MEANDFVVKQVHIRIKIQLMYDGLAIFAVQPILEFTRICCDFLVRDAGFESALEEIVGNIADSSPVGTIPTALTRKGMHLKLQFLHKPLHRLMVDHIPKISHMRPKTPIPVIFVFFANGKDNLFSFVRYFRLSKFLLPIYRSLWENQEPQGCLSAEILLGGCGRSLLFALHFFLQAQPPQFF